MVGHGAVPSYQWRPGRLWNDSRLSVVTSCAGPKCINAQRCQFKPRLLFDVSWSISHLDGVWGDYQTTWVDVSFNHVCFSHVVWCLVAGFLSWEGSEPLSCKWVMSSHNWDKGSCSAQYSQFWRYIYIDIWQVQHQHLQKFRKVELFRFNLSCILKILKVIWGWFMLNDSCTLCWSSDKSNGKMWDIDNWNLYL